jgi:hypothetical protein
VLADSGWESASMVMASASHGSPNGFAR